MHVWYACSVASVQWAYSKNNPFAKTILQWKKSKFGFDKIDEGIISGAHKNSFFSAPQVGTTGAIPPKIPRAHSFPFPRPSVKFRPNRSCFDEIYAKRENQLQYRREVNWLLASNI